MLYGYLKFNVLTTFASNFINNNEVDTKLIYLSKFTLFYGRNEERNKKRPVLRWKTVHFN